MIAKLLRTLALAAGLLMLSACGGGGGSASVSNALASNTRFGQVMAISFSGQGLDQGVELRIDGPCSNPTKVSASTAFSLQYTCTVTGTGRITSSVVDSSDGVVLGSLAVDIPLPQVTMTVTDGTRSGSVVLELDPAAAPKTVSHFLGYVGSGFYAGTVFHRVNPALAVLGGGYVAGSDGTLTVKAPTRSPLALEVSTLSNQRGTVAIYRDPGATTSGPLFFINTVDNPGLDAGSPGNPEGYAVFGRVVSGLEVVDEMAKVPVRPDLVLGLADVPLTPVRISAMAQSR
jgi:peptidyl-prolyl cis-trans isomerase A (cyclophilin A)